MNYIKVYLEYWKHFHQNPAQLLHPATKPKPKLKFSFKNKFKSKNKPSLNTINPNAAPELEFCQIWELSEELTLGLERVELRPDETAILRVMSNETLSEPYRRKVKYDRLHHRYILFNGRRLYLDDKKTQPLLL